jgi:amidase
LTEIFFDEAIRRAEELDAEQASNPSAPLRPLHGVPISLKDSHKIPGYDSTVGLICFANKPDNVYSPLAQQLLDLGAVLYCKTNVPQTMMTADSDNNVFGRTLNPANVNITAGGSSGGEGALIAMRGSILGVGTDIAGSIRIPSLCNGIYGLRPTVGLVPMADQRDVVAPGTDGVMPVAGPMAISLRSCDLFMKALSASEAWKYDDSCLHLNRWDNRLKHTNLRIGVVRNDGMYTPWPPVRRAMEESASKLRASGFELVELAMPDISEAVSVTYRMYSVDGCEVSSIDRTAELTLADACSSTFKI